MQVKYNPENIAAGNLKITGWDDGLSIIGDVIRTGLVDSA